MYLAKVCMDIVAKHTEPNEIGVRIAEIDEMSYRKLLWNHKPLTSFWRVGKGIADKLEKNGLYTMGDVARCSLNNENLLYKLFGVNAELLIDHAWGWEPTTIKEVKAYKPERNSISSGQVLHCPYKYEKATILISLRWSHTHGMRTAEQTSNDYGFRRQRKGGTLRQRPHQSGQPPVDEGACRM